MNYNDVCSVIAEKFYDVHQVDLNRWVINYFVRGMFIIIIMHRQGSVFVCVCITAVRVNYALLASVGF